MNTTALRERLHDYIDTADDKMVEAIYTLFEDKLPVSYNLLDREEVIAELNQRSERLADGSDPGLTLEQFKENIKRKQLEYLQNSK